MKSCFSNLQLILYLKAYYFQIIIGVYGEEYLQTQRQILFLLSPNKI